MFSCLAGYKSKTEGQGEPFGRACPEALEGLRTGLVEPLFLQKKKFELKENNPSTSSGGLFSFYGIT